MKNRIDSNSHHDLSCECFDGHAPEMAELVLSRRGLLRGAGYGALGAFTSFRGAESAGLPAAPGPASPPVGMPLRIHPVLTYEIPRRQVQNSWRDYGALHDMSTVNQESKRIAEELKQLASRADFPIDVLPVTLVNSDPQADRALATDCDALLIYASGGWQIYKLVAKQTPKVVFIRHKSGPYYLWHEIAHFRLLRMDDDGFARDDVGLEDIVVDSYDEVLWRLRALYGLKNAKGTRMLAIGGLSAYSKPGQELGPAHAKEVWKYQFETISEEDFAIRLQKNRADQHVVNTVEQQTKELLARPDVRLSTDRKYVFNSFMALWTVKEVMAETGCSNFGFARCMARPVISVLDTPPCMVLSLANDEGYTAYCHTDLTHTLPGVLLHWISGKPTFVCNSHMPHDGLHTVAHCQAPRKMNGKEYEPATIMTHFESDYGAAVKVDYTKGQVVTVIIPNLHCTKWQGFRGRIVDTPSHPACRSQMDIAIEGNWRKMLATMQGFHNQVCYGDYLREVGYALKKLKAVEWENFSEPA